MIELVRTDTAELLSIPAANRLIKSAGFGTQITAKTTPDTLEFWGDKIGVGSFVWVQETESPSPDHRKTGFAEIGEDNIWRAIWEPIQYDMKEVRARAVQRINAHFQQLAIEAAGRYPDFEIQTWRDQEAQALAYQAWVIGGMSGPKPPTPALDRIAAKRSRRSGTTITVADFYLRVLQNAAAWRPIALDLSGDRQGFEDLITAACDADDHAQVQTILASLPTLAESLAA